MVFKCGLKPTYCNYILFLASLKRPHEWPKHVNGEYVIKLHLCTEVRLLVFLKICIHLINARNMEHIMLYSPLMGHSSHFEKR
jgi:hypothetical protein